MAQCLVGQILDQRYKLEQMLGSGGMGTVYKAQDLALGRTIAIKVLQSIHLSDNDSLGRFEREGKILSCLSQRHITTFYHFGTTTENCPYIAMEFLNGTNLRTILNNETTLSWRRTILIGIQVCEALEQAHKQHLLHRDLKPENLVLLNEPEPDYVKLVDFGLAKMLNGEEQELQKLTLTGEIVGSVLYLSPEQCQGQKPDIRTDIYSLACVLYEAVSGRPPFTADNPVGIIYKHVNETPSPISRAPAKTAVIPCEFEQIIFKAMSKAPSERYQSMSEFQHDLELLLSGRINNLSVPRSLPGQQTSKLNYTTLVVSVFLLLCSLVSYFGIRSRSKGSSSNNNFNKLARHEVRQKPGATGPSAKLTEDKIHSLTQNVDRMQRNLSIASDEEEKRNIADRMAHMLFDIGSLHEKSLEFAEEKADYKRALALSAISGAYERFGSLLRLGVFEREHGSLETSEKYFNDAVAAFKMVPTQIPAREFSLYFEVTLLDLRLQRIKKAKKDFLAALAASNQDCSTDIYKRLQLNEESGNKAYETRDIWDKLQQCRLTSTKDKIEAVELSNEMVRYLLLVDPPLAQAPLAWTIKTLETIPQNTGAVRALAVETHKFANELNSSRKKSELEK